MKLKQKKLKHQLNSRRIFLIGMNYKTLLNIRFECEHQDTWLRTIFPVASILYSKPDYLKAEKGVKKPALFNHLVAKTIRKISEV